MAKRISTDDLRVGMYVVLPGSWLSHRFLTGRFLIRSQSQIDKIVDSGFDQVEVDVDRSDPLVVAPAKAARERPAPTSESYRAVEQRIREIGASNLSPEVKAFEVYQQSLIVVEDLMRKPTAEFVGTAKKAVGEIVDVILADDDTSVNLLRMSSHDTYTYVHSVNVGVYATALAKRLYGNQGSHNMRELGAGFFLHDLGKIRIRPSILSKPGKLTKAEEAEMRTHAYESFRILRDTSQLSEECRVITLQHHEREDGSGYPYGLKGDAIHEYARICSIADAFDALTSARPYRRPLSAFGALELMRDEMLGHFHVEMLAAFIKLFAREEGGLRRAA